MVFGKTRADMGTAALPWSAVVAMVRFTRPGSALYTVINDDPFTYTDHLLMDLYDVAALLLWAKSADAQKGRNRPKPRPRPGVKAAGPEEKHFGSVESAVPVDEFHARWAAAVAAQGGGADGD